MANQKILEQKQKIVEEIAENVKNASSVVFFEYAKLTDADMKTIRRKLRECDSELKIYKNTLTKRALDTLDINLDDELVGPKAIAFGSDAVAPIKVLNDFAKTNDALQLKVGIVDGEIADLAMLKELASIPSREGLLTMLAAGMMEHVRNLSIALNLYAEQKENEN